MEKTKVPSDGTEIDKLVSRGTGFVAVDENHWYYPKIGAMHVVGNYAYVNEAEWPRIKDIAEKDLPQEYHLDQDRGNAGIVVVVYGYDFEAMYIRSLKIARQHTDMPVHIITNIKNRSRHWNTIPNVSFSVLDHTKTQNRWAKTGLFDFTPFEYTLFLDADTVIKNKGVESFVSLLQDKTFALWVAAHFPPHEPIINIYKRAMDRFGIKKPIYIFHDGCFAFIKNEESKAFLAEWCRMWRECGEGRDMPAFACAVKSTGIEYSTFPKGFFSGDGVFADTVIEHCSCATAFCEKFGLPEYRKDDGKEGEITLPDDWSMEITGEKP